MAFIQLRRPKKDIGYVQTLISLRGRIASIGQVRWERLRIK